MLFTLSPYPLSPSWPLPLSPSSPQATLLVHLFPACIHASIFYAVSMAHPSQINSCIPYFSSVVRQVIFLESMIPKGHLFIDNSRVETSPLSLLRNLDAVFFQMSRPFHVPPPLQYPAFFFLSLRSWTFHATQMTSRHIDNFSDEQHVFHFACRLMSPPSCFVDLEKICSYFSVLFSSTLPSSVHSSLLRPFSLLLLLSPTSSIARQSCLHIASFRTKCHLANLLNSSFLSHPCMFPANFPFSSHSLSASCDLALPLLSWREQVSKSHSNGSLFPVSSSYTYSTITLCNMRSNSRQKNNMYVLFCRTLLCSGRIILPLDTHGLSKPSKSLYQLRTAMQHHP